MREAPAARPPASRRAQTWARAPALSSPDGSARAAAKTTSSRGLQLKITAVRRYVPFGYGRLQRVVFIRTPPYTANLLRLSHTIRRFSPTFPGTTRSNNANSLPAHSDQVISSLTVLQCTCVHFLFKHTILRVTKQEILYLLTELMKVQHGLTLKQLQTFKQPILLSAQQLSR